MERLIGDSPVFLLCRRVELEGESIDLLISQ